MRDRSVEQPSGTENVVRMLARILVLAGGVFWIIAAFAGPYVFDNMSLADSLKTAVWPFLAALAILAVGWIYEHLAAVLLFAASTAALVWGVIYGWEVGVWVVMAFVLFAPMMMAAVMFLLAARAEARRVARDEAKSAVIAAGVKRNAKTQAYLR